MLVNDGEKQVDVASDAATLRRLRRGTIAMIFQQFGVCVVTARERRAGLELRGESASSAAASSTLHGRVEGRADRYGDGLSGGMQQRVGLARAFATDAVILPMDEPFSALVLEPPIRTKLQDELLALQARVRKTILFVTHDLDEALKLGNETTVSKADASCRRARPKTSCCARRMPMLASSCST